MKQYVKIYCCGDCIQYNWRKHKCNLGAHVEGKPSDSFYQDCPLGLHEEEILPYVEPERKKGKWNNYKDEHSCSVCHNVVIQENWDDDIRYNFCPYCGMEMEEGEE